MMAWQDAAISVLSIVFLISHAIYSAITASLAAIAQLGLFILRLASWSISAFSNTLLFVFAPVIYTIRFVLTPFFYVFNRLPRLEFGSAAFVGVTFGLILMLTSNSMFAVLGLYDSPDEEKAKRGRNNGTRSHGDGSCRQQQQKLFAPSSSSYYPGDEEDEAGLHHRYQRQQPTTPLLLDGSEQERLDALLSTLGYPDSDLGGLAMHGWRDSPNIKRKRRSAAASRIGTILEEDDDSF